MGACYSVYLKVDLIDEEGAIKALNEHMAKGGADYSLEEYAHIGATPDTFDGLMKILFAEAQRKVDIFDYGRFRIYENDFDASYGWEGVMMDWFHVLAPFLKNGSELIIYPDNGYDKLVIRNGKCVQIH